MKALPDFLRRLAVNSWPLLLPAAWLAGGLAGFPYPSATAAYSDFSITHYPNTLFLQRSLWQAHQFPLWSDSILGGYPFIAHPLSGIWYLPGWLALVLPLPFGLNLLVILHLAWGGAGMYRLLRAEGLAQLGALAGGLAFQAWPKLYAHLGAGHLTLLYAISWTPWLLWAAQNRLSGQRRLGGWAEGVVLALIFLADPRWAGFAGAAWLGYLLVHNRLSAGRGGWRAWAGQYLRPFFLQTWLAACLAAPLALPLLEFVRLSTRTWLTPADTLAFSLPPGRLLGLVYPDFGGFHEFMAYPGAATLLLAGLALSGLGSGRAEARRWWGWLVVLATLYALGEVIPGMQWLTGLPGFDLLRAPSRALFLQGMGLAALAGYAVDGLAAPKGSVALPVVFTRRRILALAAITLLVGFLAVAIQFMQGRLLAPFAWGAVAFTLGAAWLALRLAGRLPASAWLCGLAVLASFDWTAVNRSLFAFQPAGEVLAQAEPLAEHLAAQAGPFRIYSPSYSLPQQTAARYALQQADGIDPLQLQAYVDMLDWASGVPRQGYSVTAPPFASGDPRTDNAGFQPDPRQLGLLNVRYVAAEFELEVAGLEFVQRFGETRLYRNLQDLPRVWIQPESMIIGQQARPVEQLTWRSGRVTVQVEGPGMVVISENMYPGWRALVNGRPAEIVPVVGLVGVLVGWGPQQVDLVFRPFTPLLGVLLAAAGVVLAVFLASREAIWTPG